jgi:transposase
MKRIVQHQFAYFIGIDVSRNKLDLAVMHHETLLFHRTIKNAVAEILVFLREIQSLTNLDKTQAVFCMEATGIYCNHMIEVLASENMAMVRENPLQILNSLGKIRGKTDKIDAIRIANYTFKNRHELSLKQARRPVIEQLAYLSALRRRMVATVKALRTPVKEQQTFINRDIQTQVILLGESSLNALILDIKKVEKAIAAVIKDDIRLKQLDEIITSVPHIGMVTCINIIIATNEFKDYNNPKNLPVMPG